MPPQPAPNAPAGGPPDPPRLSVASVARRLGVAPATLRTWDRRYGIGPSGHVPGRHRRYSADDVARLELMQHALVRGASPAEAARYARAARLPRPDAVPPDRPRVVALPAQGLAAEGPADLIAGGFPLLLADGDGDLAGRVRVGGRVLRLPGAGRRARGLGRGALALDPVAVRWLLDDSIRVVGPVVTWDEVVRPVLVALAERWTSTGAGVEIEHLVSECVGGAYGVWAAAAPPPGEGRPVLLAGVPGELHALPLAVLAAVLAHERVACRQLGANLPGDALASAVRRTAPAVVVLWSQMPGGADPGLLRGLPRTRPRFRTFVAGPGWSAVGLPPRAGRLVSLQQAVDLVVHAAAPA